MENPGKETYVEQMERVNQTNPFMLHNRIRAVALSEDRAEVRAEITEDSLKCLFELLHLMLISCCLIQIKTFLFAFPVPPV